MFEITSDNFCDGSFSMLCYGLKSELYNIYVPAFSTSKEEAQLVCDKLNSADTDCENIKYILEDFIVQRHLVLQ